jgi:hypothetical protein
MVAKRLGRVSPVTATRARLAAVLVVAVLVLVGCGGGRATDAADVAKVKATVQRALMALADGKGPAFCALATAGARAELARTTPGAGCAGVVRRISRELSDRVKLGLRNARVGKVSISRDRATIRAGEITSTRGTLKGFLQASAAPTQLIRQPNGSWEIAG